MDPNVPDLVGQVGFGTWAIGGHPPERPALPDERLSELLDKAAELAVAWIDTAGVYGLGRVERLLGELRAAGRSFDDFTVVTKAGISFDGRPGHATIEHRSDPSSLRRDCEDSLRRLQVDQLDVLLLHHPDAFGVPVVESWAALLGLRDEGLVRGVGVSNLPLQGLRDCASIEVPSFHQFGVGASDFDELIAWGEDNDCTNMIFGILRNRNQAQSPGDVLADWKRRHPATAFVVGASTPAQLAGLFDSESGAS